MDPGDEVKNATATEHSNGGLRDFFIVAEIMNGTRARRCISVRQMLLKGASVATKIGEM